MDPLIVELLSLFTAVCCEASNVLARKGMRDSNPMTPRARQGCEGAPGQRPYASYRRGHILRCILGDPEGGPQHLPESAFGAVVGAMATVVTFGAYIRLTQRTDTLQVNWRGGKFFIVNGVVVTLAWLSMFTALTTGNVSVVTALGGTSPLFAVLLSAILLRGSEELNLRIAVGCLAIVAGAVVITLF